MPAVEVYILITIRELKRASENKTQRKLIKKLSFYISAATTYGTKIAFSNKSKKAIMDFL